MRRHDIMKVKCINKVRDGKGAIIKYQLIDEAGNRIEATSKQIKAEMQSGRYEFINLKLDKAGRLIDKVNSTQKYFDNALSGSKSSKNTVGSFYTIEDLIKGNSPKDRPVSFWYDGKSYQGIGVCMHTTGEEAMHNIIRVYMKEFGGEVTVDVDAGDTKTSKEAYQKIHREMWHAYSDAVKGLNNIAGALDFYRKNKNKYRLHLAASKMGEGIHMYKTDCPVNPNGQYHVVAVDENNAAYKILDKETGEEYWENHQLNKLDVDIYNNKFDNVRVEREKPIIVGDCKKVKFADIREKTDLIEKKMEEFIDHEIETDILPVDENSLFDLLDPKKAAALRKLADKYNSIYGKGCFEYKYMDYAEVYVDRDDMGDVYVAGIEGETNFVVSKNKSLVENWLNNFISDYIAMDPEENTVENVMTMLYKNFDYTYKK